MTGGMAGKEVKGYSLDLPPIQQQPPPEFFAFLVGNLKHFHVCFSWKPCLGGFSNERMSLWLSFYILAYILIYLHVYILFYHRIMQPYLYIYPPYILPTPQSLKLHFISFLLGDLAQGTGNIFFFAPEKGGTYFEALESVGIDGLSHYLQGCIPRWCKISYNSTSKGFYRFLILT